MESYDALIESASTKEQQPQRLSTLRHTLQQQARPFSQDILHGDNLHA